MLAKQSEARSYSHIFVDMRCMRPSIQQRCDDHTTWEKLDKPRAVMIDASCVLRQVSREGGIQSAQGWFSMKVVDGVEGSYEMLPRRAGGGWVQGGRHAPCRWGKAYVRMPDGESRSLPDGAETHLSYLTRRQAGLVACKRHLAGGDATGNAQRVPLAKMSVWQNRSRRRRIL